MCAAPADVFTVCTDACAFTSGAARRPSRALKRTHPLTVLRRVAMAVCRALSLMHPLHVIPHSETPY
jgi:hypothetical protein